MIRDHKTCWICKAESDLFKRQIPLQHGSVTYSLCENCNESFTDAEISIITGCSKVSKALENWILKGSIDDFIPRMAD